MSKEQKVKVSAVEKPDPIDTEPGTRAALAILKSAGLDTSGLDKRRRRMPDLVAQVTEINDRQLAVRADLNCAIGEAGPAEGRLQSYRQAHIVSDERTKICSFTVAQPQRPSHWHAVTCDRPPPSTWGTSQAPLATPPTQ